MLSFESVKHHLHVSKKFLVYMERHRLYELFHELALGLTIEKPANHILYLKQNLEHAVRKRDFPRIILLAPSEFDSLKLAKLFERGIGARPVTFRDVCKAKHDLVRNVTDFNAEAFAQYTKTYLQSDKFLLTNWIFVDFPRTKVEARKMQSIGIIPTHVIDIEYPQNAERIKNDEELMYDKRRRGLRDAYSVSVVTVKKENKTVEDIFKECIGWVNIKSTYGLPISEFRIVLIGSLNVDCCFIAEKLVQNHNLIHVDFYEISAIHGNTLSEVLEMNPENRFEIIQNYLCKDECVDQGWVLTNFPSNVEEFQLLDSCKTPPNRIFFVGVNENHWLEKLSEPVYKIIDTGEYCIILDQNEDIECSCNDDKNDSNTNENEQFRVQEENFQDLLSYAGLSCTIIESVEKEVVLEKIFESLKNPAPFGPLRIAKSFEIIEPVDVRV